MQKFLLSGFVLITFVLYSIYERGLPTSNTALVAPLSLNTTQTPVPSVSEVTPSPTTSPISSPTPIPISKTPTPTIVPTRKPTPTPIPISGFKDGTFTGNAADAFYGYIQVKVIISNGRIASVQFLQYPNDRNRSIAINEQADPMLAQEAIQVQSAHVDIISGATASSEAFIQSLQSALDQSKG